LTTKTTSQKPVRVIRPYGSGSRSLLSDFRDSRHMFWNMVRTSALLPYNDLMLGFFWTMFRPLVFLLVVVFIKKSSRADMGNQVEYELFVFSGIIAWWYFADAAQKSAQAIYNHRGIITKMYFPRIIIPIIPVFVRSFDLGLQLIALFLLMAWFGRVPDQDVWVLPLAALNLVLLALAVGFLCSVLSTYFRDIQQALVNLLYVGMFLSPVIYSASLVPEQYRLLYKILNPAVGPLTNLRAGLFDIYAPDFEGLIASYATTLVLLTIGVFAFKRIEDSLAERVL
jgi:lipopolysaccharide transport system permease protein